MIAPSRTSGTPRNAVAGACPGGRPMLSGWCGGSLATGFRPSTSTRPKRPRMAKLPGRRRWPDGSATAQSSQQGSLIAMSSSLQSSTSPMKPSRLCVPSSPTARHATPRSSVSLVSAADRMRLTPASARSVRRASVISMPIARNSRTTPSGSAIGRFDQRSQTRSPLFIRFSFAANRSGSSGISRTTAARSRPVDSGAGINGPDRAPADQFVGRVPEEGLRKHVDIGDPAAVPVVPEDDAPRAPGAAPRSRRAPPRPSCAR